MNGDVKVRWVKYKKMGGPRYLGKREKGKFLYQYDPPTPKPWGVWSQILGVVAECEGNHDTVVMYDETGVTFGAFQWTFKSGRLQKLLEFFKSVPVYDFDDEEDNTLFSDYCMKSGDDGMKSQIFEDFGFIISKGKFVSLVDHYRILSPWKPKDRKRMVNICMGRHRPVKERRRHALGLCEEFVWLGQNPDIQFAMAEYAKIEFKRSLDVPRKPLLGFCDTIRGLLNDDLWGTPIPAIFFSLYQNYPLYAYRLFVSIMKEALKKGMILLDGDTLKYYVNPEGFHQNLQDMIELTWKKVCLTSYVDWGFRSKQYIKSGGKNPPRIKRLKPAIKKYYGLSLPYVMPK